jgi:tyrosinase
MSPTRKVQHNEARRKRKPEPEPHMTMAAMPETFADMLRFQPEVRRRLKLPDWLKFFLPYARKDQASLTELERERFLCAFNVLNNNGTLGLLVDIHGNPTYQPHSTQRFLPWHRIYLLKLEQALQAIHPDVTLPYWDWTQASEQAIPPWLASFTPTVITPTQTINVTRFPQSASSLATIASNTPNALAQADFTNFTSLLQGIHNSVHVWVGGSMGSVPTAPADPIFWMHHCNIDRLWWQWQKKPGNASKHPVLSGAAAVMDPWPNTEVDTRSIVALSYTYV